ncbi:MAG: glycoside hydrolase [Polyangiaceae bacterium]
MRALAIGLFCSCLLLGCDAGQSALPTDDAAQRGPDFSAHLQHISGFGASSAWTLPAASDELADSFFSVENGIGLSLLRVRITPSGTTDELVTAQKALARGASVWAAPWSPPGEWKSGGSAANPLWGGKLLPERYDDWANRLASFVSSLRDAGVPLLALSAQNEPTWVAQWETSVWTPSELAGFVRDHLGPALANAGVPTPILAPESNDWNSLASFADALLEDPDIVDLIGPVATHSYGGSAYAYATPARYGKELWQTEISEDESTGMNAALTVAEMIQTHLTVAGVSAWHYWWLVPAAKTGALTVDGNLTRTAYALGNFARFVRPGFVRVRAPASPAPQVKLTAFTLPDSGRSVLVLVNSGVERSFELPLLNTAVTRFVPHTTSEDLSLAEGAPITRTGDSLTLTLPARSVTTLVGNPD